MDRLASSLALVLATACGGVPGDARYGWFGGAEGAAPHSPGQALKIAWSERLTPKFEGSYLPVEQASAALDPQHDRIYVGSTAGELLAFTSAGKRMFALDTGSSIEAAPALDPQRRELFVGTEDGILHAVDPDTGEVRWKDGAGGPIRRAPLLLGDAVYVVTDSDRVVAFARADGSLLWSYRREPPDGFSIAGHAGLAHGGGLLLTGFSDGVIVALDPTDGRVAWERDTSLDLSSQKSDSTPVFVDVDTTPLIIDDTVYAAGFSAGLYGLALANGTVLFRDPDLTGITGLSRSDSLLVIASADSGISALRLPTREPRWRRALERGAPTQPLVVGTLVLYGESDGSLIARSVATGKERARIDAGRGFSAAPAVESGLGVALSNGGSLYAFSLGR